MLLRCCTTLSRTIAGTVVLGPLKPSRSGFPPTSVATLGPAAALSSSLGWLAEAALGAALRPRKASSAGGSLRAAGYRIIGRSTKRETAAVGRLGEKRRDGAPAKLFPGRRSEEQTSELQSLMSISY